MGSKICRRRGIFRNGSYLLRIPLYYISKGQKKNCISDSDIDRSRDESDQYQPSVFGYELLEIPLDDTGRRSDLSVLRKDDQGVQGKERNYVYGAAKFTKAKTPDKLDRGVKAVCDVMLELDDHPRAIMRDKYLCEARQYSGDIKLYYGRNIHWYITYHDWEHEYYYKMLESRTPNYDKLLSLCIDEDLNFIVTYADKSIPENILEEYGFREITEKDNSIIYYRADEAEE